MGVHRVDAPDREHVEEGGHRRRGAPPITEAPGGMAAEQRMLRGQQPGQRIAGRRVVDGPEQFDGEHADEGAGTGERVELGDHPRRLRAAANLVGELRRAAKGADDVVRTGEVAQLVDDEVAYRWLDVLVALLERPEWMVD